MVENVDGIKEGDLVVYGGSEKDIIQWTRRRVHEVRLAYEDSIELYDFDMPKLSKDFIIIERRTELLENCPKCDSEFVGFDSSREMQISLVKCSDCGFKIQKKVPEERIIEIWNECSTKMKKLLNKYQ